MLALVRGPLSSPHHLGIDGALAVLEGLLEEAVREAGLSDHAGHVAQVATLLMAGVDFPMEEDVAREAIEERGWAQRVHVGNDTFAILRAGTERGWGVAVTCGAGINCVGVSPDGRHARFPALGAITGDWGGGYDLGLAAVSAGARGEDGRGPRTSLERAVPAHFGLTTPTELAEAIHAGRIAQRRVIELAPVVLAEAADDAVAAEIVQRLADGGGRARPGRVGPPGSARRIGGGPPGRRSPAGGRRRSARRDRLGVARGRSQRHRSPYRIRGDRRRSAAGSRRDRGRPRRAGPAPPRARRRRVPSWKEWRALAEVRFAQATRVYPGTEAPAVDALDLDIADGEFMVLVGPSGSGKTTALRMLAGLEEVDAGSVFIGDRDVTDLAPKDRDVSMVFQNYALYPYLTVAANIGFPLRIARVKKSVREERVKEVAALLGLTEYLERKPGQLSGGQRQRVAMGRAIVRVPRVFLMDEPLSNLDAKLRVQMRADIAALQSDFGITTVYVTHDQSEAMTLGHRVAVLHEGHLQQCDPPRRSTSGRRTSSSRASSARLR